MTELIGELVSSILLIIRLGQKLDVNIYKLTVSGTVEDRTSTSTSVFGSKADEQESSLFKIQSVSWLGLPYLAKVPRTSTSSA